MSNLENYNLAFIESFQISKDQLPELTYQSVQGWDSVGHMGLISLLEEKFDIMIETDDNVLKAYFRKCDELYIARIILLGSLAINMIAIAIIFKL